MVRISFKLFLCLIHSYQNIYLWKMKKFQFSLLCNLDSLQEVIRFSNKKSVTLLNFKLISIFNFSFKKWNFFSTILFKYLLHSFIANLLFFVMICSLFLQVNVDWELSELLCDLYIAIDVICSTASIFNLVAISFDRFV